MHPVHNRHKVVFILNNIFIKYTSCLDLRSTSRINYFFNFFLTEEKRNLVCVHQRVDLYNFHFLGKEYQPHGRHQKKHLAPTTLMILQAMRWGWHWIMSYPNYHRLFAPSSPHMTQSRRVWGQKLCSCRRNSRSASRQIDLRSSKRPNKSHATSHACIIIVLWITKFVHITELTICAILL